MYGRFCILVTLCKHFWLQLLHLEPDQDLGHLVVDEKNRSVKSYFHSFVDLPLKLNFCNSCLKTEEHLQEITFVH